jgi:hypothetical protein
MTAYEKTLVAAIGLIIALAFFQPYFEKEAFNKFSNTKATYWDALVSDLRILPD